MLVPLGVFLGVLVAELALVAAAGTDAPWHDAWNAEGQWLYPKWHDGTFRATDLLEPVNEHRIAWTQLLNLSLFVANGQWDPLVQLVAIAVLRAACAAGIAGVLSGRGAMGAAGALAIALAFLPHLAWHAVLWGFESQVYFALGFGLLTLALATQAEGRAWSRGAAWLAGLAAMLGMGPALLVPIAWLGVVGLRGIEARRWGAVRGDAIAAVALLAVAMALRVEVAEHETLRAGAAEFFAALGKLLGWPHVESPFAALVLNLPLAALVWARLRGKRRAVAGEDFVLASAAWSVAIAVATAWVRGGSAELRAGVPSRYVDFVVLLPLANLWCAWRLVRERAANWRWARWGAVAWTTFLVVGWTGLSAEVIRGLVLPRMRDRAAPERLLREFQLRGGATVFAGQPRLLVPHPNLEIVRAVLEDPRMRGRLPPTLQPEREPGPLSRGVRALLGRQ